MEKQAVKSSCQVGVSMKLNEVVKVIGFLITKFNWIFVLLINCCCLFVQKQRWKLIGQLFKIVAGKLAKSFSWKWIKFLLRWNECSPDCNWGLAKTQESWHRDRKVSKDFKVILGLKLGQDILQLRSFNHNNWKYGLKSCMYRWITVGRHSQFWLPWAVRAPAWMKLLRAKRAPAYLHVL